MAILAKLAEAIAGPWLKSLVLPALILALVTLGHQMIKARSEARLAREAHLVATGRQQCLDEVRLAEARAALEAEQAKVKLLRSEADAANAITEEVHRRAQDLEAELNAARRATSGGDPRCLSDGVLDLIRERNERAGGGDRRGSADTPR